MHPVLLKIGPLSIYTYGVFAAIGLLFGISLALRQAKKEGYDPQKILDLFFYSILAGIIGSRVFYVVQHLSTFQGNLLDAFKLWEGGLVFYGGLLFAVPVAWFLLKRQNLSFWKTFDLIAPSMAIGQALGRIGCFYAGCCYGLPTQLPWGVTFTHPESLALKGIPLHPAQLYDAGAGGIIFFILIVFRKHTRFPGQLSLMYLCLHSIFRFFIELFRGDPRLWIGGHTITLTQVISISIFWLSIGLYFYFRNKQLKRE